MQKKISLFSLVILITAAIDNIRNLPSAALFGSAMIFFFAISAVVFLIPTALVAAELSAAFPDKGGIYMWVERAFGKKLAMLAIWLQWINTVVWYPAMLLFIAGTLAYLFNPDLVQNKTYVIGCILTIFWVMTLVNLKGLYFSSRVNNILTVVGMIFPMCLLIVLGGVWVLKGEPLQISVNASNIMPSLTSSTNWISLIAIMASFLGMELSGVHVNDIENPQRNFPRAVLIASFFIFSSMLLGSLSIACVLPANDISLVSGVMQVITAFFKAFGLEKLIPVLTVMIVIGSLGTMINWLISPAKGLLHAAEYGFLPKLFSQKNKHGVARNILIAQAILVTVFCLVYLLEPSVNGFYWFLTALSTELYMIMYVLMFGAAIKLHYQYLNRPSTFKIPGKSVGIWATALLGLSGCITTIVVSFFPPENIDIGSNSKYLTMIILGNIITISPIFLCYLYKKRNQAA
jgi:amino acid transporter